MATANQEKKNQRRKTHPSLLQWDSSYQKTIWLTGTDVADVVIWRLFKSSASPFLGRFILILKQSGFRWHIKAYINHSNSLGYFFPFWLSATAQKTHSQVDTPKEELEATDQPSWLQVASPRLSLILPQGRSRQGWFNIGVPALVPTTTSPPSWVWFKLQSALPISLMAFPLHPFIFFKNKYILSAHFLHSWQNKGYRIDLADENELARCQLVFICRLNTLSYLYNLDHH